MRRFTLNEWNIRKIDANALSRDEVEAAFDSVFSRWKRRDGSVQMYAEVTSGPRLCVIRR